MAIELAGLNTWKAGSALVGLRLAQLLGGRAPRGIRERIQKREAGFAHALPPLRPGRDTFSWARSAGPDLGKDVRRWERTLVQSRAQLAAGGGGQEPPPRIRENGAYTML